MGDRPAATEIEVSVFGRGYGEAITIHYGDGNWIIIDSLADANGESAPLSYLKKINVDPQQIKILLATHWHDDHIRGLASIYEEAASAEFFLSAAMTTDEWNAFNRRQRAAGSKRVSSGLAEMRAIASIQNVQGRPVIKYANINRILLRVTANTLTHGEQVELESLAPGDADIAAFHRQLDSAPHSSQRVMPFSRNDISVPTWLRVGQHRIILCADLETVTATNRGWNAVLNSTAALDGKASLIKVAHHGSKNGHHEKMWEDHIAADTIAVLTPWNRGSKLPTKMDVDRIVRSSGQSFSCSRLDRKARRRPSVVEKTLGQAAQKIRARPADVGQVRIRFDPHDSVENWRMETLDGALKLENLFT